MKIKDIILNLQRYSTEVLAYKLDAEFAAAVDAAANLLEAQGERIADLENELRDEMYRHDRLQDFEVAEAEELRKAREQLRWIPVTERLPELIPCATGSAYSEAVIVWTTGRKAMVAVWDGIDFLCAADYWDAWDEDITYWMPLPEPPKEVDDGKT